MYLLGSGNNGRYYDATTGRFLSEDPTKEAGGDANLYRYAGNDPVNNLDPSGHSLVTDPPKRDFHPVQTQPAQGPSANVHSKVPATGHGTDTAVHGQTGTTGNHGQSDTPPDGSKPPQGTPLHGTAGGGTAGGQHGIANTSAGPTIEADPKRTWLGQKMDSFKIWWKYGHGGFLDQHPILSHLKDNVVKPVMHGIGEGIGGLVHALAHPIDTATGILHGVKSIVTHPVAAVGAVKAAYRHFSQLPGDKKIQAVVQQTTAALAVSGALKAIGMAGKLARVGAAVKKIDDGADGRSMEEGVARFENEGGGQPHGIKGAKEKVPKQLHHFATNKSKVYTPAMTNIAKKLGLDLDENWNKEFLPHLGRHPNEYHQFVLRGMERAANEANGDKSKFIELFEKYVKEPIRNNPDLLRKSGWK